MWKEAFSDIFVQLIAAVRLAEQSCVLVMGPASEISWEGLGLTLGMFGVVQAAGTVFFGRD